MLLQYYQYFYKAQFFHLKPLHQAKLASKAKLDAIVCSAQEVNIVKKEFKKEIITPGIRFNSKNNDQKRILTPKQAYKNGSDWLVIGRPITKGNIKKNMQMLIDHLSKWYLNQKFVESQTPKYWIL